MENVNLIKPEKINLKDHPILNEHWLQDIIAKDPKILGLGDLILKDKERKQPRAGRLDILLQDADINKRYEVSLLHESTFRQRVDFTNMTKVIK